MFWPQPPQMQQMQPPQYPPQAYPPQYPQMPYGMPGYGYPPQAPQQFGAPQPSGAEMRAPEFPDFSRQNVLAAAPAGGNMGMLMGVQLEVSVVIGRTRRKIRDIVEFGQGTVLELDKQTGAPAEIMVNGQLLAYGEVIVVGDNFGIRVTEIVGAKELLDSLENNM